MSTAGILFTTAEAVAKLLNPLFGVEQRMVEAPS
jgi:hypothetical protein